MEKGKQMTRRSYTAKTPIELIDKIYKAEGWVRSVGESRTGRAVALYDISLDHRRGIYVATPKKDTSNG